MSWCPRVLIAAPGTVPIWWWEGAPHCPFVTPLLWASLQLASLGDAPEDLARRWALQQGRWIG